MFDDYVARAKAACMDSTICGRFFAMIFYSFENPAEIRVPLNDSLHLLLDLADVTFTRKSLSGERYSPSGRYSQQLTKTISTANFDRSHFLRLHDGAGDLVQTATVAYWLCTIHPEFKVKTPNYIYAELPASVGRDTAWAAFQNIFGSGCFCFAMGNEVITGHHEKHSRSGAAAARELLNAAGPSVGFWEVFGNRSLLRQLAPDKLFYGPAEFAAVHSQFASAPVETSASAVGYASTENAHYFRVTPSQTRADLWRHLHQVKVVLERPWKYGKDEAWAQWYPRVSTASAT